MTARHFYLCESCKAEHEHPGGMSEVSCDVEGCQAAVRATHFMNGTPRGWASVQIVATRSVTAIGVLVGEYPDVTSSAEIFHFCPDHLDEASVMTSRKP